VTIDRPSVHLGALKPAEDGDAHVLRLVEQHGARGSVTVRFDRPIAAVHECDLLERAEARIACQDGALATEMRPFQIRSFLIRFA
jgi:alpha-mannosidase